MLLAGCSKQNPRRSEKHSAMMRALRAAWRLPRRTQRREMSPRALPSVLMVEFRLMKTHVEQTVPSYTRP